MDLSSESMYNFIMLSRTKNHSAISYKKKYTYCKIVEKNLVKKKVLNISINCYVKKCNDLIGISIKKI